MNGSLTPDFWNMVSLFQKQATLKSKMPKNISKFYVLASSCPRRLALADPHGNFY